MVKKTLSPLQLFIASIRKRLWLASSYSDAGFYFWQYNCMAPFAELTSLVDPADAHFEVEILMYFCYFEFSLYVNAAMPLPISAIKLD